MNKLIIEARINEYANRDANPNVPWTPAEIAADATRCREAGAAIVHFHARGADGRPRHDVATYADIIRRIRAGSDILVHPTLGATAHGGDAAERIATVVELARDPATRADFAPMDMGTTNLDFYDRDAGRFTTTETVYRNTTGTLQHFARAITGAGMKHYVVSWSLGFTRNALAFMDMGLLPAPVFLLFVLTDGALLAGHPGTVAGLDAHRQMLPADRGIEWSVCNHGGDLRPLLDTIIAGGGHVAIGLGDFPYTTPRAMTNADLVADVRRRAAAIGRPVATPAEARAMLQIA